MVGRLAAVVLFLIGVCTLALGDDSILGSGISGTYKASAPAGYQGVGDVVSGWTSYWSPFAFTDAIASAGTQKLFNVQNFVTANTCDLLVATNGGLGNTASCSSGGDNGQTADSFSFYETFSAADGANISSGVMTTGADDTCTATEGGLVGVGIPTALLGLFISSVNSCINGFGGQYNIGGVNAGSFSISGVDISIGGGLQLNEAYDQASSHNLGTGPSPPTFTTPENGVGGSSIPFSSGAGFDDGSVSSGNVTPATGVVTLYALYQRYSDTTNTGCPIAENSATCASGSNRIISTTSANQVQLAGVSGSIVVTMNDAVWHVIIGVINGASSALCIDGTCTTGTITGSTSAAPATVGYNNSATEGILEAGFLDNVALTSTQRTNLCRNAQLRWGASNFGATC